jgi:thiosulfate/3-mercaptopyruvate sulfurtransferase
MHACAALAAMLTLGWVDAHADTAGAEETAVLRYVQEPAAAGSDPVLIDTRPEAECTAESVPTAVCLPPEAFFGPHRRLASPRDISWVLGTSGLRGDETVLVLGTDPVRRDAVAALLYLAGQRQVFVLNASMHAVFAAADAPWTPGRPRAMLREAIHLGPWRDDAIILRDELADVLAADSAAESGAFRLLDGRTQDEYWGARIRAARGGHLPGAEPLPAAGLRLALDRGEAGPIVDVPVIAYGHDPLTGLAFFALLRAGFGLDATLYPGGWREWAADGALPADAVTYPAIDAKAAAGRQPASVSGPVEGSVWIQSLLTVMAVVTAGGFGYLLGRRAIR